MTTSPGTFTMCGNVCPAHPELRCELASDHRILASLTPTPHLSGTVEWDNNGKHRHLSELGAVLRKVMIANPEIVVSPHLPPNKVFLSNRALATGTGGIATDPNSLGRFGTAMFNPLGGFGPVMFDPVSMRAEEPEPITATPEQQLTEWWIQQAEDEIARTVPKAIEYSATDLIDIGRDLARTAGREVNDEEAAELGVFFYLRGKMARWVGAVIAGQRVSDDTLFDMGVYVRMVERIREFGSWPGTVTEE